MWLSFRYVPTFQKKLLSSSHSLTACELRRADTETGVVKQTDGQTDRNVGKILILREACSLLIP